MSITTRFDHATGRVDRVEAVLGVGGEGALERRELGDDICTRLGGFVLEHRTVHGWLDAPPLARERDRLCGMIYGLQRRR